MDMENKVKRIVYNEGDFSLEWAKEPLQQIIKEMNQKEILNQRMRNLLDQGKITISEYIKFLNNG